MIGVLHDWRGKVDEAFPFFPFMRNPLLSAKNPHKLRAEFLIS